ncbi:MAG: DNA methyltransferase, partial [Phormidesmis sp.]
QLPCRPIACREGVMAWQVNLPTGLQFTTELRQQIYSKIAQVQTASADISPPPLVIFTTADKARSLWCQSPMESALQVSGQSTALWECRLRRLARSNKGLFPASESTPAAASDKTFERLIQGLCDGITGISSADQQAYAALTLQRLILVQSVQQRGWLNGDTWYLQTRFGRALQQGKLFFKTCLQPLYQSLSLPALERPLPLQAAVGTVPFLGHWFETHRLERQYDTIAIADWPFEEILGWLSEQTSADRLNPWMSGDLGYWMEHYWAQLQPQASYVGTPALARQMSDRFLDHLILDRLHPSYLSESRSENTLNDRLFTADTKLCRRLIQEVLPELRILDPACGCGNLLVAIHQRLTEIFSILVAYIETTQDTQLQIWRSALVEQTSSTKLDLLQRIQRRILKNNLHGVELSAGATETAQLQLLLHTIATAQQPAEIEPLTDLNFNIMSGNSLIGLVKVDEESFDRVNPAETGSILQGNLLQPLVADSYQTILAEKNLTLEHYRSRDQKLADARDIPGYARAALLREDIARLDAAAQNKLDTLLLNHMSQQLGIQYKAMQLTEKPQRQQLTIEDIDILKPFHWGYHFNKIIQRGGFDGILCAPPWGAFKPTAEEFFQRFQDLAETKKVTAKTLKTSKQELLKGDPEVTQAWLFYQDQYAYVSDYFYRSEQYAHQNPQVKGKPVRQQIAQERLFVEQCFNLLAPRGTGLVILPYKLSAVDRAKSLHQFLQENTLYDELACPDGEAAAIAQWKMPYDSASKRST